MKVYYLLASAFCLLPTNAQFYYTPYNPFIPQPYIQPQVQNLAYQEQPSSGFGYRTEYDDGATSTVFFMTGPQARSMFEFKSPKMQITPENPNSRARSLASDLTDSNAIPNPEQKIENLLRPNDFQRIFDSIVPGFVNYYNYPASTVPLALARQLNTNSSNSNATTEEHVAAESVVNPKILINNIDNMIKELETTTENKVESTSTTTSTEATTKLLIEVTDAADDVQTDSSTSTTTESKLLIKVGDDEVTTIESTTTV